MAACGTWAPTGAGLQFDIDGFSWKVPTAHGVQVEDAEVAEK